VNAEIFAHKQVSTVLSIVAAFRGLFALSNYQANRSVVGFAVKSLPCHSIAII
jgi:hypothetical protein